MAAYLGYVLWATRAFLFAAFDLFRGRWWHALLLNQAVVSEQVRRLPATRLARQYLFHNSNWLYRPLWTYEAEARGSEIIFYFYSTNCEGFRKLDGGAATVIYGYQAMNWPIYLVWDDFQARFVRRCAGPSSNIKCVGPIWFQSSELENPTPREGGVAVFDVTPFRASYFSALALDNEFYTPPVAKMFLGHTSAVLAESGFLMLWKRKRSIGRMAHPHYRLFADRLAGESFVYVIDPGTSAVEVIEASTAVVSMPFTSTALIAKEMGKPSVYYDPTGLLHRDDPAAHGIPVVSSPDELKCWLRDVVHPYCLSCSSSSSA
jgi:polysaccharide biosynthesis PFTS motif protein